MHQARLPTYFLSHGAGPWSFMEGEFRRQFHKLEQSLTAVREELGDAPKAILIISAHWEANGFVLSSAEKPGMIYDYSGFPEHTYHVHYRAPGSPALAHHVAELLRSGGVDARLDPERGYDHGAFGLLKALYPDENIPVVQLSLDEWLEPAQHLAVGRVLTPLRDEGVLIIGSGQSFQNLALRDSRAIMPSRVFDDWLQQTLVYCSPEERRKRLVGWERAPYARIAHPGEEHLIPLMVAVGAAGDDEATCVYHDQLLGVMTASSFRFGRLPRQGS